MKVFMQVLSMPTSQEVDLTRLSLKMLQVRGRIDLSVFIDDKVFIFEFKVDSKGALEQIKEKNYQQKYMRDYHDIYLIGVEFDSQKRSVESFSWELG